MILDTAFLEEMIQDNSFSGIPRLVDTERTDRIVCIFEFWRYCYI